MLVTSRKHKASIKTKRKKVQMNPIRNHALGIGRFGVLIESTVTYPLYRKNILVTIRKKKKCLLSGKCRQNLHYSIRIILREYLTATENVFSHVEFEEFMFTFMIHM